MAAVFENKDDIIVVDKWWIERVKAAARTAPLRRARLNLHKSADDQVQEMLIAFCGDSLNAPHRHVGKSESMHLIEGRVLVVFFDEEGMVTRRQELGGPGTNLASLYRLSSPEWHTVVPLDDVVVIHEVTTGPFRPRSEALPSWVPVDDENIRRLFDRLKLESLMEESRSGQK
jgi:cupin fold WbuC family metalloprotein